MYRIEKLSGTHDRKAFDCGTHPALNVFLQQQARQQSDKDAARTFVLVEDCAPTVIIGFFTLVVTEAEAEELPISVAKKYRNPVGAARLARLAVDKRYQRKGIGTILLAEAMRRVMIIADHAGMVGLFVDAKDEEAQKYYTQYGFEPLQHNTGALFLPIGTIRTLVAPPKAHI